MTDKKMPRPNVAASERDEGENAIFAQFCLPYDDFTPPPAPRQQNIRSIIPIGESNAISMRDLAALTGVTERTLRHQITADRERGLLIASSDAGYFFPANEAERERYIRRMKARLRSTASIIRAAEQAEIVEGGSI